MASSKNTPDETDFFELVGYTFRLIGESWKALKLNIWTFIAIALLPMIIIGAAASFAILMALGSGTDYTSVSARSIIFIILVILVSIILVSLFVPAMTVTQLYSAKGKKISVGEAVHKGFPLFLRFLGLIILVVLAVCIGTVLLIIPGILAAFFFSMSTYIMFDKNTGVIEAMKRSYQLVKSNWLFVLALFMINIVVSLVSYIPFIGWITGLILSIAYFCLPAIVYNKISKN